MNIRGLKRNAEEAIRQQTKLASEGKDFSTAVLMEAKRQIELIDSIAPQITPEEWQRIKAGVPGIDRDMRDCKDIKDRLGLSWNELKMLKDLQVDEPKKIRYRIDIVKALTDSGYVLQDLRRQHKISESTLQKIRNGELITLKSLEVICELLDMQPADLIEYS